MLNCICSVVGVVGVNICDCEVGSQRCVIGDCACRRVWSSWLTDREKCRPGLKWEVCVWTLPANHNWLGCQTSVSGMPRRLWYFGGWMGHWSWQMWWRGPIWQRRQLWVWQGKTLWWPTSLTLIWRPKCLRWRRRWKMSLAIALVSCPEIWRMWWDEWRGLREHRLVCNSMWRKWRRNQMTDLSRCWDFWGTKWMLKVRGWRLLWSVWRGKMKRSVSMRVGSGMQRQVWLRIGTGVSHYEATLMRGWREQSSSTPQKEAGPSFSAAPPFSNQHDSWFVGPASAAGAHSAEPEVETNRLGEGEESLRVNVPSRDSQHPHLRLDLRLAGDSRRSGLATNEETEMNEYASRGPRLSDAEIKCRKEQHTSTGWTSKSHKQGSTGMPSLRTLLADGGRRSRPHSSSEETRSSHKSHHKSPSPGYRTGRKAPVTQNSTSKSRTGSYENLVDVVVSGNFWSILAWPCLVRGMAVGGCSTAEALPKHCLCTA